MTLFHLANCAALAFAPHVIIYRYSGLGEYSGLWRVAQAVIAYCMTQFVKMMLLATFFVEADLEGAPGPCNPVTEFMRSSVDVIDLIGIHLALLHFSAGKGEVRFLTTGLSWAASHSVATYLIPLFVGARGAGFSWQFIHMAINSNIDLVFYLSLAPLVWLFNRKDAALLTRNLVTLLLVFAVLHSAVFQVMRDQLTLSSWTLLGAKAVTTGLFAALSFIAYCLNANSVASLH